jgi:hypothetical protein
MTPIKLECKNNDTNFTKSAIDQVREKSASALLGTLERQENENNLQVNLFGFVSCNDTFMDEECINALIFLKEKGCDYCIDVFEEGECQTLLSPIVFSLNEYLKYAFKLEPILQCIEEEGFALYDAGTEFSKKGVNISKMKTSGQLKNPFLEIFLETLKEKEGENLLQVILFSAVTKGNYRDEWTPVLLIRNTFDLNQL